jgi:diguanylate cyclase (GGDEF)-like protein/PAS domain S-box-containing protein
VKTAPPRERKGPKKGGRTNSNGPAPRRARSETQLAIGAFEQSAIGMALLELNGNWIRINPGLCRILGYSEQELLAKTFQSITHPEDLRPELNCISQVLKGEIRSFQMEKRYLHKAGHTVPALLTVSLVCDGKDKPLLLCYQLQDITERKHAEEKLRGSEDSYRRLVELSPDAMLVQRRGTIIYANAACGALLGASSPDELLGKPVLQFVHPDDREAVRQRIEIIRQDSGAPPPPRTERRYIGLDGREVEVEVVINRIIYQSEPATEAILRDISQRKQAERKLRRSEANLAAAQRVAHLGSFEHDLTDADELNQNPLRWSSEVFRILGYEPGAIEVSTENFLRQVHPDDRNGIRDAVARAIRDGKSTSLDYRLIRRDGAERIIHEQLDVVYDEKTRKPTRLVGAMQDITDAKLAEAQLREANQNLAERLQELDQRSKEINLLSEMGSWLQSCQTTEEAYAVICKSAEQLFPEWSGALYVISASRNAVEAVADWGKPCGAERVFAPDDCWALRRGQPHWFSVGAMAANCRHTNLTRIVKALCVPLMAQGEALGILSLQLVCPIGQQESVSHPSDEAERRLAAVLAEHVCLALGNLKLRETLRNQSIRDPLTGLFNRRYMEDSLEREISRANRRRSSVAILMMDLDRFKRFNDTFGHQAGDALLRAFGDFLTKNTRGQDIACRYGGEEFAVVLSDATLAGALQRADILREEVKQLKVHYGGQLLGMVSISMGLALFPDHGATIAEVLRAADQALYSAKREGRDRVHVWSSEVNPNDPGASPERQTTPR